MAAIKLLDTDTINQIAAGEVIDRPCSIVKELLENAIDAGASAVTVEIKEGGISFIRITDNGCGIGKEDVEMAFMRHCTSKITTSNDLLTVKSLGFRGEALSSVAAVAQVELITKPKSELMGIRYVIEGGVQKSMEDIGTPDGTTFIVRNLFYNTPARRKFLKSAATEAGYISNIVEQMALSHPEISFRFINNNQNKLHTSGKDKLKDVIYQIYGREITTNLIEVEHAHEFLHLTGYIGKPVISRGNRNFENYFINGRYIKNNLIAKAVEEAYKPYMMQHKYPFTALHIQIDPALCDVNVHPSKMEIRFRNQQDIYAALYHTISAALSSRELIPSISVTTEKTHDERPEPLEHMEPFETKRMENTQQSVPQMVLREQPADYRTAPVPVPVPSIGPADTGALVQTVQTVQMDFFEERLLSEQAAPNHKILGQLFDTYWLIEYQESLYIIDQHAAHEKVLYERTMKRLEHKQATSQQLHPPLILSLTMGEEQILTSYLDVFTEIGYEIEPFGGHEYAVRAVPDHLVSVSKKELLLQMLDTISEETTGITDNILIRDKIASMSCKAAVKGNMHLSFAEAEALISELLTLENPYHCPHGRPTIITMTKYELEKKFKRII